MVWSSRSAVAEALILFTYTSSNKRWAKAVFRTIWRKNDGILIDLSQFGAIIFNRTMYLFGKRADKLDLSDIYRLVNNRIQESKNLDFKKELKISSGDDRKEFLADVSAMMNTEGGCIIFGIEEAKGADGKNSGIACSVNGIQVINVDSTLQQIESLVENGLDPKSKSLIFSPIHIDDNNYVLVVGIPQNIGLPSMVSYSGTNKFYSRGNTGKYLPDVIGVNQMFTRAMSIKEKAEAFRQERIQLVRSQEFLTNIDTVGSYFMHVVPLGRQGDALVNLNFQPTIDFLRSNLKVIEGLGGQPRYNVEGYCMYYEKHDNRLVDTYAQIFRDGCLEFYTNRHILGRPYVHGHRLENIVIENFKSTLNIYSQLAVEPPFVVFLSLFDLETLVIKNNDFHESTSVIGRKRMLFSPLLVDNLDVSPASHMKPILDIFWQSGNMEGSPNYNKEGQWIPRNY
ncbi:AlbA family DNA-binding domain-containing protein [Fibrisoma limi]|nr:ATP-binding protein [Fibrisoma limi]